MPKSKHSVWVNFRCVNKDQNSGKWAICKKCEKEMQGIPQRMLKHIEKCLNSEAGTTDINTIGNINQTLTLEQEETERVKNKNGKLFYLISAF